MRYDPRLIKELEKRKCQEYVTFCNEYKTTECKNICPYAKKQNTLKRNIKIKLKGGLENFVLDHELMYIGKENRAGWDYLYENCFDGINKIIDNNVKGDKHNKELVYKVYTQMLEALEKAKIKMDGLKGDKKSWYETYNIILEFSKKAKATNLKVITINIIDQHLRRSY